MTATKSAKPDDQKSGEVTPAAAPESHEASGAAKAPESQPVEPAKADPKSTPTAERGGRAEPEGFLAGVWRWLSEE